MLDNERERDRTAKESRRWSWERIHMGNVGIIMWCDSEVLKIIDVCLEKRRLPMHIMITFLALVCIFATSASGNFVGPMARV